jgi:hypothetical protein
MLGLTGLLSYTTTNEFHFSYLRDFWNWGTVGAIPQVPGTTAALELGGETTNALVPKNLNATSIRTRTWNSHHWNWNDTFSKLQGNHLIQFGGNAIHTTVQFHREDGQLSILQPVDVVAAAQGSTYRQPAALRCATRALPPTAFRPIKSAIGTIYIRRSSVWLARLRFCERATQIST